MDTGTSLPILLAAGREESLRPLLVQLIVIILAARAGAAVARWLRQPSVVGEIVAGLLLVSLAWAIVAATCPNDCLAIQQLDFSPQEDKFHSVW